MGGGFYAGRIRIDGQIFALIVAPKADGEINSVWNDSYESIVNTKSFNDGLANTIAMAKSGSRLALWSRNLMIGGNDDWYIPAQDELEIIYRNLKPTTYENAQYMRSGINLSTVVPMPPYTPEFPAQTQAESFQEGGNEAFENAWYWSSTQYASASACAWTQDFYGGGQYYANKDGTLRARAVRRLPI